MKLRLLSWNLGGTFYAAQRERAWHYLCALNPDIALLQEATPPEWMWAPFHCLHTAKVGSWCSMIAVRDMSINRVTLEAVAPAFFDRYVVSAAATLSDGRQLRLASVHAPASTVQPEMLNGLDSDAIRRRPVKDVWYNDLVYWVLRRELTGSRFVVAGDWNTARLFDRFPRIYGYGGQSKAFFDRAADDGWFECLRKFHEDEQCTYFKSNKGPYELDHAFCSPDIAEAITGCYVDERPARDLGLSDHAPIVMELDLVD